MKKRIAVLVRAEQGEALRMAVGLTLMDDMVDIYVLDGKVEETEKNILNLETAAIMDIGLFTNFQENSGMEYLPTEEIAQRLIEYDVVLPY